ncbi:hypothetical protein Sste5346_005689 [Sporothrix stenoceras]|uniref:ORP1 like protein n=1 Tax=Sporothrix stenoceras TaxID=5173 RepID=A0ABR3Z274_9PEZI
MDHDSSSSSPTGPEQSRATPGGRAASSEYPGHSSSNSGEMPAIFSSPMNSSPPGLASTNHQTHNSASSLSGQASNSQPTAAATQPVNFETASECMYRGDCQTGSQLRKAISHIFGRNKLCTRMIPTGVWVHYCRKHYQRTRYRNGGEYPQRQIGLVQTQIHRVQAWSDSNAQQNRGPVLKDWSLSVRKREQMRLDSKSAANGKKRTFEGMDEEEDNFDDDRAEMSGTAVPEWVVAQIGDGFSTAGILEVVERLKSDIDAGRLQQIPDIEILPNIVTDANSDEPASNNTAKKTYTKRRTASSSGFAAGGHRRSQSVNTSALRSDSIPMARRSSQPNNYNHLAPSGRPFASDYHQQAPMEKRQRTGDEGMGMGIGGMHMGHRHHHSMGGMSDRFEPPMAPRPGFSGRMQLAHRPAFAGIRESHAEGQTSYNSHEDQLRHQMQSQQPNQYGSTHNDFYPHSQRPAPESSHIQGGYATDNRYAQDFEARREHERHHSTSSGVSGPSNDAAAAPAGYGVLPAPNPQRFGSTPVAQQLETSQYVLNSASAAARRPNVHQRSQSEAGFMHHSSSSQYSRLSADNNGRGYAEEVPRTTTYQPYSQQTHSNQAYYGQSHGHAHSHSHAGHHHHAHSYGGSQQEHGGSHYRNPDDERRDSRDATGNTHQQFPVQHQYEHAPRLAPPVAQTTAPAPVMAPAQPTDKFDMVQLPPIQSLAPPPTTTAAADKGAGLATPQTAPTDGTDRYFQPAQSSSSPPEYKHFASTHSRSSSSVTPAVVTNNNNINNTPTNTAGAPTSYISPVSPKTHSSSPMSQPQAQAQSNA